MNRGDESIAKHSSPTTYQAQSEGYLGWRRMGNPINIKSQMAVLLVSGGGGICSQRQSL